MQNWKLPSSPRRVLVRVYAGGQNSPQFPFFLAAIQLLESLVVSGHLAASNIEYQYVATVRKWTPMELMLWLRDSDIHFILTHPHQGHPQWSVPEVYAAIQILKGHAGFPSDQQLDCPIFLQHKYDYLLAIRHIVNPTIAIQLPVVEKVVDIGTGNVKHTSSIVGSDFDSAELRRFLNRYNEGDGWVVKHPFVTVREGMKFCSSHEEVRDQLAIVTASFAGRLPYTMIQPKLINRKEYKIVVLNGKASHILPQNSGVRCKGRAFASREELFLFAETAVRILAMRCPGCITSGLVRVDVMTTKEGNYVVNEFEGLEALWEPSARECVEITSACNFFLFKYWHHTVKNLLFEVVNH